MATKPHKQVYQQIFFDRLLLIGIIFLALTYILRDSWGGAFAEAAAIMAGVVWAYRAVTTNPSKVFRLLAFFMLVLLGSLLALYLGGVHGQL